jgi:tripartite-type tricarboxylate transporter receptor subunit TctC
MGAYTAPMLTSTLARFRVLAALILLSLALPAAAQTATPYPERPVRVIVGWAPGGAVDLLGRYYGQKLGEAFSQNFVVENRPGASSNIATDLVAKSKPDGYVLLTTSAVHSINPSLYSKLPYDAVRDFAAVSPFAFTPNVIAVHPSVPAKNLRELISLAKARPDAMTFSSSGGGTLQHIGMVLFNSMAGVRMLHVPYNGTGPAVTAAVGGQVDVISGGYSSVLPFIGAAGSNRLRVLATSSAQRMSIAPDIPTIAEAAGLPTYEVISWLGLVAPAGTPVPVVQKLNTEVGRIMQRPDTQEWLARQGLFPNYDSPAGFAKRIESDVVKYGKVVREIGAKVE